MRIALCLSFLATLLASGLLFAEGEDLRTTRIDVQALTEAHAHRRGRLLGAPAPGEVFNEGWGDLEEPRGYFSPDVLVELIHTHVQPRTWETIDGAYLEARQGWLHMRNRPEVVAEVEAFLYQLSLEAQQRVLLNVEVKQGASEGMDAAASDARTTASGSLSLPLGVERALEHTSRVRYVADYEVEIAQGSNISNPVVLSIDGGFVGSFVATPTIDGDRIVLEGLLQTADYGEPRKLPLGVDEEHIAAPYRSERRQSNGEIELPQSDHAQAHFTAVLPAARGTVSIPLTVRGRSVAVQIDTRLQGVRGKTPTWDLRGLTRRPMAIRFGKSADGRPVESLAPRVRYFAGDEENPVYRHEEEIVEELRTVVDPAYWEEQGMIGIWDSGRMVLRADDRRMAAVRSFLLDIEKQALRPLQVELRVWSRTGPVRAGPADAFPREGARLVAGGRVPTLSGRMASLMIGSTANYVADYDVEVAQEARIADPIIGQAFDGLVANVRPTLSADKQTVGLSIQMLMSRRTIAERAFDTGTRYLGPIDHVQEDRRVVQENIRFPTSGVYLLDLGVDPTDETRRLVGEVRVAGK